MSESGPGGDSCLSGTDTFVYRLNWHQYHRPVIGCICDIHIFSISNTYHTRMDKWTLLQGRSLTDEFQVQYVCLLEFISITKIAAIMYGMYIINGV